MRIHRLTYVIAAVFAFWIFGGVYFLNKVIPPRRPRFMPKDSVWIDAPPLPISWHHGWWFGCNMASSGTTDYCRLIRNADDGEVYGGEYLPCRTPAALPEDKIRLVPPKDSSEMWLFHWRNEGVVGFLADGDLLLPASMNNKCEEVAERLSSGRH